MHTLSKSDFKLACTCPTKLYYKEMQYPSTGDDDLYLQLLADGGYMVEEIARIVQEPPGRMLSFHSGTREAAGATAEALRAQDTVLFEATLLSGNKMARVDILVKRGDAFEIIEVKSKSYDGELDRRYRAEGSPSIFRGRRGKISSDWENYLLDVAYQADLLQELYPAATVSAFLLMPDKSKTTGIEDIHQQFTLTRSRRAGDAFERTEVAFTGDREALKRNNFLSRVEVTGEIAELMGFVRERAAAFASSLVPEPRKIVAPLSLACASCEYRVAENEPRNGFAECWGDRAHLAHHVLDLFSAGTVVSGKGDEKRKTIDVLIEGGLGSLLDIPDEVLVKTDGTVGTVNRRQLTQIRHSRANTRWVGEGLAAELGRARYPLHFIDFETSALAVPYHPGMRPYEQAAFQWSCHTVSAPGARPVHDEWLNATDSFPNYGFARALRDRIADNGTVLIWSKYERSVLRTIRTALLQLAAPDADLAAWIERLAVAEGSRFLDMNELAKQHYFDPRMKGRTSIKVVLDAVWQSDERARHEFPEYAANTDSPYKALPDLLIAGREVRVAEGTAAMRAYQEMMYGAGRHDEVARRQYQKLLLDYCRLDTAAMVIIWRHWERLVRQSPL